eukprot:XP_011670410.1 PREDICTED: uncharacterized protein LOC105441203 [Strongylocentrotus purpuratus]
MISVKFVTIKGVLIITNGQNLFIAFLIAKDVIPCVGPLDSAVRGAFLYNMLVIFEMFLLNFFFKLYYWRWMVKHEYGQRFVSASVGEITDIKNFEANAPMNVMNERINGSLSNVSK